MRIGVALRLRVDHCQWQLGRRRPLPGGPLPVPVGLGVSLALPVAPVDPAGNHGTTNLNATASASGSSTVCHCHCHWRFTTLKAAVLQAQELCIQVSVTENASSRTGGRARLMRTCSVASTAGCRHTAPSSSVRTCRCCRLHQHALALQAQVQEGRAHAALELAGEPRDAVKGCDARLDCEGIQPLWTQ